MKPSYVDFSPKDYKWSPTVDYRKNPHLYHIGRGQQGVLVCEPYKSELCQHWKFKTPKDAKASAEKIHAIGSFSINTLNPGTCVLPVINLVNAKVAPLKINNIANVTMNDGSPVLTTNIPFK